MLLRLGLVFVWGSEAFGALGSNPFAGIDSIRVFGPGDDVASYVSSIYEESYGGQFTSKRWAVLLKSGDYGSLSIPVGYYTSIAGVGSSPDDVKIQRFYAEKRAAGDDLQNFWRSVEGVTTGSTAQWAVSQSAPLRRSVINGDLPLWGQGHNEWSSGGFIAGVRVNGQLKCGTQQQFFFRNSEFQSTDCGGSGNFIFASCAGAPPHDAYKTHVAVDAVADKPYLVEANDDWNVFVPGRKDSSSNLSVAADSTIPLSDFYIAKEGDTASSINAGIENKKGLILTPAIYKLADSIVVAKDGFVVLGLGLATLVSTQGKSALRVDGSSVRVASILFEAGASSDSEPLLHWVGDGGVASDVFGRVAALQYMGCSIVKADIMMQVDGDDVIIDNTWQWVADHDDCDTKSNECQSSTGLKVTGARVVGYGIAVEHQHDKLTHWTGEDGKVFMYQAELPYFDRNSDIVGYFVDYSVQTHTAYGLGVYVISGFTPGINFHVGFRMPPTATVRRLIIMNLFGPHDQIDNTVCTDDADQHCAIGTCSYNACRLDALPEPSSTSESVVV